MKFVELVFGVVVCCGTSIALLDNHASTQSAGGHDNVLRQLLAEIVSLKEEQASQKQKIDVLNHQIILLQQENKLTKDKYTWLESEFDLINSSCACSRKPDHNNGSEMNDLKTQIRYLSLSVLDVDVKATNMNRSIHYINESVNKAETDLRKTLIRAQHEQERLSAALTKLTNEVEQQKNGDKSKISFTAGLSSKIATISDGETVIFDKVISNIGGGYNPTTGVFTSTKDGTFVFYSSTYTSPTANYHRTDLVLNGNSLVEYYAYDHDNNAEESSGLVVIRIHVGDRVWVRHKGGLGYYTETPPWTTFSGFML